jgi:L-amino acid N-acyltransferase YncA
MERWYPYIRLPITIEQFHTLPRNSAYRYEFFGGMAHLSARPKCYHCVISTNAQVNADIVPPHWEVDYALRPLDEADWERMPKPFAHAMFYVLPFASLDEAKQLEAARDCLQKVRDGQEGPLIPEACFVVADQKEDRILGGALVTMWKVEEFDREALQAQTLPHLTWIFITPMLQRHGIGSLLLSQVLEALRAGGHPRLSSTFLLGNDASAMWHWRHGFQLAGYMMSPHAMKKQRERWRKEERSE